MIKNDENSIDIEGKGEVIISEWVELSIKISEQFAEHLNKDTDFCLNSMIKILKKSKNYSYKDSFK